MTPDYQIRLGAADGLDITGRFVGRNIALTVVDATGTESDSAEIAVLDPLAQIEPPRRGAVLAIAMGYRERGLVPMGLYRVDATTFAGYPHRIAIAARSADNRDRLKERRTQDYGGRTLGEIAAAVAGRHGLTPRVAGPLAGALFPTFALPAQSYVGQHEESDIAFLTRLAGGLGASVTVKHGHLVVTPAGTGKSVSGAAATVVITPQHIADGYEAKWKDRPRHGKAEASYFDRRAGRRVAVSAGDGEGAVYRLRGPYPESEQAMAAATAKAAELGRAEGQASFTVWGDPAVRAGMQLVVRGVRAGVDGAWTITRAEHAMSGDAAYLTRIAAEVKGGKKAGGKTEE